MKSNVIWFFKSIFINLIIILESFAPARNEIITKAKMCRICYSRLTKFNITRNKMLNMYDDYIYIIEPKTKSACYIFYNKHQIDICFKGTSTFNDICFNLDIYPRIFINDSIRIHNGFLKKYLSMKNNIIKNINFILNEKKYKIREISFNGHSSGGAIANIASLDMSYIYDDLKIKCITFGAPRVGNKNFIEAYNSRIKNSLRVVNQNDIITHVPLPIIYTHIHKPLVINHNNYINNNHINIDIYKYNWNIINYFKSIHSMTMYIKNL